jgi:hypothetical protein
VKASSAARRASRTAFCELRRCASLTIRVPEVSLVLGRRAVLGQVSRACSGTRSVAPCHHGHWPPGPYAGTEASRRTASATWPPSSAALSRLRSCPTSTCSVAPEPGLTVCGHDGRLEQRGVPSFPPAAGRWATASGPSRRAGPIAGLRLAHPRRLQLGQPRPPRFRPRPPAPSTTLPCNPSRATGSFHPLEVLYVRSSADGRTTGSRFGCCRRRMLPVVPASTAPSGFAGRVPPERQCR